ncbi:MAG: hypothetical protein AAF125_04985 [Chloroflexota bacterium]
MTQQINKRLVTTLLFGLLLLTLTACDGEGSTDSGATGGSTTIEAPAQTTGGDANTGAGNDSIINTSTPVTDVDPNATSTPVNDAAPNATSTPIPQNTQVVGTATPVTDANTTVATPTTDTSDMPLGG